MYIKHATAILLTLMICSLSGKASAEEAEVNPAPQQQTQQQDQNRQLDKIAFTKQKNNTEIYSENYLIEAITPYQLFSGTVIPAVLVTGMNSDLPGTVIGQVSQNVFDSQAGKYLLIPQGTRLIGIYDSKTTYAQERGLVIWQRMILPNGKSYILDNLSGTDQAGYAGFKDKVQSHYGRVLWSAILGGVITGGVAAATSDGSDDESFKAEAGAQAANNISSSTNSIVQKNLGIQPTIIVRPGYQFNIIVNKDMLLEPYTNG